MQVIVHDYETTGIKPRTCGVVQSAIWIVEFAEDGSYEILAQEVATHNPDCAIPDGASAVHGFLNEHVDHLPSFTTSISATMDQAFSEFSPQAVMGYNNTSFDNIIAYRCGMPEQGLTNIDMFPPMKKLKARGFMDSAKLSSAYQALTGDEEVGKAHDAEFDLKMTCALVQPLMKILEVTTFSDLIRVMNTPVVDTKMPMPFGKHADIPLDELRPSYVKWVLKNLTDLDPDLEASLRAVSP